jgi:tyrosine aminotransferase
MRVSSSNKAKRTFNPIRAIVDNLKPPQNHPKKMLNLALGDPTAYGNLHCPEVLVEGVRESLECVDAGLTPSDHISRAQTSNGYQPSTGSGPARKAIAQISNLSDCPITEDDVIICSGCSGALELAITVLVNEGPSLLNPCSVLTLSR